MSIYNSGLNGLCEDIVAQMESLQGDNYTFKMGKQNGALDAVLNPINQQNSPVEILSLSDSRGKLKSARVVYKEQLAESEAVDGTTAEGKGLCDTSYEPEPKEVNVAIDDAVGMLRPLGFTESKLREYCQDSKAFMNDYLFETLRVLREKFSQKILTDISADIGKNYEEDGTTTAAGAYKSVDIINTDGTPLYQGFDEMIGDYENNNLNGTPILIGEGNWSKYHRLQGAVCCNSTTPFGDVDPADSGVLFFKDQHANSILGSNKGLVIAPGASQLITFQENDHLNLESDIVKHIVIPDPVYGNALRWDLDFKWDECNKKWVYFVRTYYKIFNTFQSDAFPSGSPLGDRNGMTGIFGYTGAQA